MLVDSLRKLPATGPDGFEGLTVKLLSAITGRRFHLAKSGTQSGRDISARDLGSNVTAVECKRFGEKAHLSKRALLGEMAEVKIDIIDLDLWVLVTSRTLPSQTIESLHHYATQQGFEFRSISTGDGEPSSLEVVCAASPGLVLDHLHPYVLADEKKRLKKQLKKISATSEFVKRTQDVRDWFLSPSLGYDSWRVNCNELFIKSLHSDRESRANYGQILNVEDPGVPLIDRRTAWEALDEWYEKWNENHNMFIMLGEESDGKTWSVASWLSRKTKQIEESPSVIFLASKKTESNDPLKQVSTTVSRMMRHISIDKWNQRLARWITDTQEKNARIILVLDGINEHFGAKWWRDFLENLQAQEFRSSVAVIVTCRTGFWKKHFEYLRHIDAVTHELLPYDDKELAAALGYRELTIADIPAEILPLIRKPRYFDLMIKFRDRVSESGDITVTRLIYEDWRDRLEHKSNLSDFDDYKFQDLLKELASEYKRGKSSVTERKLDGILPSYIDKGPIIEELRTGGIISDDDNRVDEQRLIYGFGLLLVDRIREEWQRNDKELTEIISSWLEPHSEMDIKASICEFAALHALSLPNISQDIRVALLLAWVNSHNPGHKIDNTFGAYLPADPASYFKLAEYIWSDADDNPWAQHRLMRVFLHWQDKPRVASHYPSIFERWLGLVHICGFWHQRGVKTEHTEKIKDEINERVGRELQLGSFDFAGRNFTAIEDDGLLRLGRVALNVISQGPRESYIGAIATGCLAETIMGSPDKYELFNWIFITSNSSLFEAVQQEVERLGSYQYRTVQQAIYRILSFEGSVEAKALKTSLPKGLFPVHSIWEEHKKDPCTSGLAWKEEDLEVCLGRDDLEPHIFARQLKPHCINPKVTVPDSVVYELESLAESIPIEKISTSWAQSIEDHHLSEYEPSIAAYAPHIMATVFLSLFQQVKDRDVQSQKILSTQALEHYLLFTKKENAAFTRAWEETVEKPPDGSKEGEWAELFAFNIVLQDLSPEEQLSHLLKRPANAHDLARYAPLFKPIRDWDSIPHLLADQKDTKNLDRILWFLSTNPEHMPAKLADNIVQSYLDHPSSMVRAHVLNIVYHSQSGETIKNIINGSWAWDKTFNHYENNWGSILLCDYGNSIPYDELRARISPQYIGYAIQCRGMRSEEVEQYAKDIHLIWQNLASGSPDLPADFPPMEIEVDQSQPLTPDHYSISDSVFSRSIEFVSRNRVWGGQVGNEISSLKSLFGSNRDDRQIESLYNIMQGEIEKQNEAGNLWLAQSFSTNALSDVVRLRPDLLHKWVNTVHSGTQHGRRLLDVCHSFYKALCAVLLDTSIDEGIRLYWKLKDHGFINIVDRKTGIQLLDYELFRVQRNTASELAWTQRLKQCHSDRDLLEVAILAQLGNGKEWLQDFIREGLGSKAPYSKARAMILIGFLDNEEDDSQLNEIIKKVPDTWEKKIVEGSLYNCQRNLWAKHWFRSFFDEEDVTLGWRSFRLFLECVTSMYWIWHEDIIGEFENRDLFDQRLKFVSDNSNTIKDRIKRNEKKFREKFLGQKILKGQAWPWVN